METFSSCRSTLSHTRRLGCWVFFPVTRKFVSFEKKACASPRRLSGGKTPLDTWQHQRRTNLATLHHTQNILNKLDDGPREMIPRTILAIALSLFASAPPCAIARVGGSDVKNSRSQFAGRKVPSREIKLAKHKGRNLGAKRPWRKVVDELEAGAGRDHRPIEMLRKK
jgi:hypothetical protein